MIIRIKLFQNNYMYEVVCLPGKLFFQVLYFFIISYKAKNYIKKIRKHVQNIYQHFLLPHDKTLSLKL